MDVGDEEETEKEDEEEKEKEEEEDILLSPSHLCGLLEERGGAQEVAPLPHLVIRTTGQLTPPPPPSLRHSGQSRSVIGCYKSLRGLAVSEQPDCFSIAVDPNGASDWKIWTRLFNH